MRFLQTFRQIPAPVRQSLTASFIAGLMFWSSLASLLPTLPLYVDSLGGTNAQIGWVMGAFAIGLLTCRAYLGRLADRKGRRLVMQIGLGVATIVPLLYAISPSIPVLMVLRAIHGISIAAFATGFSALIADLSPVEQRGEIIGYMSLVNPLGLAFGPAFGGWMQEIWGYQILFVMSASLALAGLLMMEKVTEPKLSSPRDADIDLSSSDRNLKDFDTIPPPSRRFWQTLWSPRVRVPATVLFMIGMVFGTLSAFLPLLIKQQHIQLNAGLFYMTAAIAGFIIRLPIARISDRYGRGVFISIGLCFYALSMATVYSAQTSLVFLIAGGLEGIGSGIVIPAIATLLADRSVASERGFVFGLAWAGFDLGIAIAGPIMGNAIVFLGLANTFVVSTALSLLALAIFSTQSNHNLADSWRFATGQTTDKYAVKGT
ncbi:MFS transporter [Tumidithrix elongata RA019]|uniref:MFS transporter n=1 Tax=Tumidithrix elongata BACA0141 TaxID=2716417 RepID=A0AAW9PTN6_9CYAN|nr:MFS transporter [Tumidithrix elongata RA019]